MLAHVPTCVFCSIRDRELDGAWVLDGDDVFAVLDVRPVFKGHVLVMPREHHETLPSLPAHLLHPLFATAQRVCDAMTSALDADGTFVAMNNVVSQSVPHLHVHVVPRRRKDGLRGFFWPRTKYDDAAEMAGYAERIKEALA